MNPILVVLGFTFLTLSSYLLANSKNRALVLNHLHIRRRHAAASLTPPRSLPPGKQGLSPDTSPSHLWNETFPPSRRHALTGLTLHGPGKTGKELSEQPPDYSRRVPDTEVCNTDALADHITATGFTVEEIKRLGDFPDYAVLSGVPLPEAVGEEFDVAKALPRPYRPFRWAYHQTMSFTKIEPDWWLELEQSYVSKIAEREALFERHGPMVLQTLPGSEIAAKELMEMCLQFYIARYPKYFSLDKTTQIFHNSLLHTSTSLRDTDPMHVLLHNVPEDFAMMLRNPTTGEYSLRGGIICSSLGWDLGSKVGMGLHEIHEPIPDYKEKMAFSMERYFAKKPTDKPIQRGSWGLEIDTPLFMPPNDPHEALRSEQNPAHTLDRCHLRVDWQTLRRLPLSGAVAFNFKALFTPVAEFRDEPYVPSLLVKVLREGKRSLMEYKNTWHTEHVVIPAMEAFEREQVERGVVEVGWEAHTLEEAPFFPGWERKWRGRQGF